MVFKDQTTFLTETSCAPESATAPSETSWDGPPDRDQAHDKPPNVTMSADLSETRSPGRRLGAGNET